MDYNEVFRKAVDELRHPLKWDLELTQIELYELRKYVKPVVDHLRRIENKGEWGYDPEHEIALRFLHDWYGIPIDDGFINCMMAFHHEELCDYLKIIQKKSHMP